MNDIDKPQGIDFTTRVQVRIVVLDVKGVPIRTLQSCWLDYANPEWAARSFQWIRRFLVAHKKKGRHIAAFDNVSEKGWKKKGHI